MSGTITFPLSSTRE